MPKKLTGKAAAVERTDEGPAGWLLPDLASAYGVLTSADPILEAAALLDAAGSPIVPDDSTDAADDLAETKLADVSDTVWCEQLAEYKRRKAVAALPSGLEAAIGPAAPAIPGGRNWLPLGPTVVMDGQTVGNQPVAGRISGIAIAPGGALVYAASACGGVFRSDDGGTSWRSMMDGFDVDPTNFASASLACGAIAIDLADPQRVYVGTGEGDTHQIFRNRIVSALPAYRGIGPIRSDDGGLTWRLEPTAANSPDLAGKAFFGLAVDPNDREHVVAATTEGLYQRQPAPAGGFHWTRRRLGVHCSVVSAGSGNTRRFFAAEWGQGVFHSSDGATWTAAGTGFPTTEVGRIALAVQRTNPNLVYAMVVNAAGALRGVYRLDGIAGTWKEISSPPPVLPTLNGSGQGDYDLAIAVDPLDANLLFLGGSYVNRSPFPGSVWRCPVKAQGAGFRFNAPTSIGERCHADIHVLVHAPDDPNELWCGCDGGTFLNRNPRAAGRFSAQNSGLSCLCSNFIAQHPTDPNLLFTGLQDNGTAFTDAGPVWKHVNSGDGGYCLVNWANPDRVLSFANGKVFRSMTGGATHDSWQPVWEFGWATMTQPIVCPPYAPATPAHANVVAVGAGPLVFVSNDFASTWPMSGRISLPSGSGAAFALSFANSQRLFIGTTTGRVFRADRQASGWTVTQLHSVAAGPLTIVGLITDVAVDWADANLESIYVSFGGAGNQPRVWHFDGTRWEPRSGTAATGLLPVEHNALAVDSSAPDNVYVGADIGVWHSADRGQTWQPFQHGLPDAPVFDLQIHPTQRLLRAATHGRGVYEIPLS